jgi:hypothetical protein
VPIGFPHLIDCLLSKLARSLREGDFEQFLKPVATLAMCLARLVFRMWVRDRDFCLFGYNA